MDFVEIQIHYKSITITQICHCKKRHKGTRVADVEVGPMNMLSLDFNFLEIQIILNTVTQSSGSQIAAKGMSELQVQIQMHVINILCPSANTVKVAEEFRDEEVD